GWSGPTRPPPARWSRTSCRSTSLSRSGRTRRARGARRARGRGARAGRVRELHETVDVTDLEPDLDLGTDSEHVALPEVELVRDLDGAATRLLDLGHAVGDRALRETD